MRSNRQLNLNRETVRVLQDAHLAAAPGGALTTTPCNLLSLDQTASGCCIISRGPGICPTLLPCIVNTTIATTLQ